MAEFYRDTNNPGSLNPTLEAAERTDFQKQFNDTFLTRLLEPDTFRQFLKPGQPKYDPALDPKNAMFNPDRYKIDILGRIGARFANRFNEFQGVSQGNEDNPKTIADVEGPNFKASIGTSLGKFVIDAGQKPNVDQVLNRAGAMTCGGCHQFTPPQQVGFVKGTPILWPPSATFVHVTEDSILSDALNNVFVPFRQARLAEAVCIPVGPLLTADSASSAQALEAVLQSQADDLLLAARTATNPEARTARTQEALRAITESRRSELEKHGYFVTNRRSH